MIYINKKSGACYTEDVFPKEDTVTSEIPVAEICFYCLVGEDVKSIFEKTSGDTKGLTLIKD